MLTYRLLLLLKFAGVILYGGGLIGSFAATALADRKRAVHAIASPGLVVTWFAGYLLTTQLLIPLTEFWILGGILLSLVSQLALVYSVSRDRRTVATFAAAFFPLFLVLALMVFRPTWSELR
ncbi:hypothetical protein [Stigmatella aurantiaca]|uniref:Conserved uncharacterized protein n=1 Tax=Stigmatella aurantiaca (strain DW4/3-1) TaxID=378806 RepID=Q095L5_STIAD|nr:hypothetical protein [Stigmatella aurantiaca]ADO68323.1 conserved uncharacterized protein [Stigmatella aurantiaca DW4/3-1]EAU67455.1 hypothetical protein STIAU_1687 [Stigmatella aurantiaca DW4/3-1]